VKPASEVLKVQVTLPEPGDEALVRCRIIEHFGEGLMVEITSPREPGSAPARLCA
jgi:hypothetical protein